MGQQTILQHLREAEQHLDECAALITEYERRVAELERNGRDATDAKELLNTMRKSQVLQERSLDIIREGIAKLV